MVILIDKLRDKLSKLVSFGIRLVNLVLKKT